MAQPASGAGAGTAAGVDAGALRATRFSTVRKGFDPSEVTALLGAAADALQDARQESRILEERLAAAAEASSGQLADLEARLAAAERAAAQADDLRARLAASEEEAAKVGELQARQSASEEATAQAEGLRAQLKALTDQGAARDTQLKELRDTLSAITAERDAAAAERDELRAARLTDEELLALVGETAGTVLKAAHESAAQITSEAQREADRLTTTTNAAAAAAISAAEEEALEYRRAAQERADEVLEEARRDADAMRRDANSATQLSRQEVEHATAEVRQAADDYAAVVRREADTYAADTREVADRDARRIVTEAEIVASAKVGGAEELALETRESADERLRTLEEEMGALRDREMTAIRQMREVRDALAQHLFATRSGLERVLNEVAGDNLRALVASERPTHGELGGSSGEPAPATPKRTRSRKS